MSTQKAAPPPYAVSIEDEPEADGAVRFTFVPRNLRRLPVGAAPSAVPEYVLSVQGGGDEPIFTWLQPPQKESTRRDLEEIARARAEERAAWIQRVSDLVQTIEKWAKDFGWSTKQIERKIEDARLGTHKAAGLVMQEDAVRVLLEPISATAPGADGLVDLYLMPGYDDIASLYHDQRGWHAHYVFPTQQAAGNLREGETRTLTRETLGAILDEMKKNAE